MTKARLHIVVLSAVCAVFVAAGQSRVTTRRGLKPPAGMVHAVAPVTADTVAVAADGVAVSGYDKPQRSTRESAFFTNRTEHRLRTLILRLTYRDRAGRVLHGVRRVVACDIPAGATRQVYWTSWDRQQSFYYFRSHKPRRSTATAYDVTCAVDSVVVFP